MTPPSAPPERETRAEKVELLRDGSVEESLSRRIDVGFGSVRIDGEKTSVPLSSLTADQVLAAETTKVPTPDLDADAVGGLLQLTSRRTFDQRTPTFRASTGASYDTLSGRFSPEGSVTYGRALGRKGRWGFVVTGSGSRDFQRGEGIDADWDSASATGDLEEVALSEEKSVSTEFAFNGLVDWKLGEKSAAQFRTSFSADREEGIERDLAYRLDDRRRPATSTSEVERSLSEEENRNTSSTLAAGISHREEHWEADLRLSHTTSSDRTPETRSYEFRQNGVGVDYGLADPRFPQILPRLGARPDDALLFQLDELHNGRQEEREDDSVASLDFKVLQLAGWKTAWAKIGTKFRALRTEQIESNEVYEAAGGGVSLAEVVGADRNDRFMGGRYSLHTFPNASALQRLFASEPTRFALDVDATRSDTDPANYDVQQDVLANYAMASVAVGKRTRVLGGVRVERTANTFTGYEVVFGANDHYEATNRVSAKGSYTNWFPGVHLTQALMPRLDLFASWTKSIRRPDYDQLVPARSVNRSSGEIEEGNPALRPTLYTNFDVALEYAYHDGGRLALEGFHREIDNTRLERRERLIGGVFDGYERTRPENGGTASVSGFEVKWAQKLGVLGAVWEDFELEANYTHTNSKQTLANRLGERIPLTEIPKHELTLQVAYELGGFFGSVEMNYQSEQVESVAGVSSDDRFLPSQTRWDVSLSYEINSRWRVFLDVENVTEVPSRSYEGVRSRVEDYELEPRQFRFGVKWEG